jgi:hypothetical protein
MPVVGEGKPTYHEDMNTQDKKVTSLATTLDLAEHTENKRDQAYFEENGVETSKIAEALRSGIEVVVVCYHGLQRSVSFAEFLQEFGVPAAHVKGGIQQMHIDSLHRAKKEQMLLDLPHTPFFIVLAADGELKPDQRAMVNEIQAAFGSGPGKCLRLSNMQAVEFIQTYRDEKKKAAH